MLQDPLDQPILSPLIPSVVIKMYFSHHLLFRPHALGGIYYREIWHSNTFKNPNGLRKALITISHLQNLQKTQFYDPNVVFLQENGITTPINDLFMFATRVAT